MNLLRTYILLAGTLIIVWQSDAQNKMDPIPRGSVTLSECYEWARENYPLIDQLELLEKSTAYNLSNASKGKLPQINLNGQATYQSEVTALPIEIPGIDVPTLSKDQYKAYAEVYQPLTHFPSINTKKKAISISGEIEKQKVEIDLYQLKDRVNQMFFGILLMEVKSKQLALAQADIDSTITKIEGAIANGMATQMDKKLLEVEKVGLGQQMKENNTNHTAFLTMLSALTGKLITESTQFIRPEPIISNTKNNRPELQLFALQESRLETQHALINHRYIPNVGLFFQGGIGRPALNFLSNEFATYYIGGVRFNWNLSSLYTSKKDKLQLEIQRKRIRSQTETFLLNNDLTQSRQSLEIDKYDEMLSDDQRILDLREEIKQSAEVQLVNGLITSIDFIKILNDTNRANQQLELHKIMRLQAQYNLETTTGN